MFCTLILSYLLILETVSLIWILLLLVIARFYSFLHYALNSAANLYVPYRVEKKQLIDSCYPSGQSSWPLNFLVKSTATNLGDWNVGKPKHICIFNFRWHVKRRYQLCSMFCKGPSSVQRVIILHPVPVFTLFTSSLEQTFWKVVFSTKCGLLLDYTHKTEFREF